MSDKWSWRSGNLEDEQKGRGKSEEEKREELEEGKRKQRGGAGRNVTNLTRPVMF